MWFPSFDSEYYPNSTFDQQEFSCPEDLNQFQNQDNEIEEQGLMGEEQINQQFNEDYMDKTFEQSCMPNIPPANPIQEDQHQKCSSTAITVELDQVQQIKETRQKIDKGQVETKNIAAVYTRSIIKAIKKRKNITINLAGVKAIKKIEDKNGAIPLVALREFLSKQDIGNFSKIYFSSFEFVDDILSSSKQKDINAPLKYLKNVYQGCLNPNSLDKWK